MCVRACVHMCKFDQNLHYFFYFVTALFDNLVFYFCTTSLLRQQTLPNSKMEDFTSETLQ